MKKLEIELNIPVTIFREGKAFVAYTPALDVSTSAKTYALAKKRFEEMVGLFLEELVKKNTLEAYLESVGWQRGIKKQWLPPTMVSQTIETIRTPVFS